SSTLIEWERLLPWNGHALPGWGERISARALNIRETWYLGGLVLFVIMD
ncbi:hypothetical protein A2U01_0055061, partial [Trifolium medium]|nr:hypothetical protein [Trifolium medium]